MRGADFIVHDLVGFAEQAATFAVAEDYIVNKQIAQQRSADFAGERAVALPMHVLRTDLDALSALLEQLRHLAKRGERRNDHDFDIANIRGIEQKRFDEAPRFRERHVHLPVRGDDFLSHKLLVR